MLSFKRNAQNREPETEMDAVVIERFGEINVLKTVRRQIPQPQNNEVLVRVKAIGVSPVDCRIRAGVGLSRHYSGFPVTLGFDVAGVVEEVARQATKFQPGDEVMGMVNFPAPAGGYAAFVACSQDELVRKPESVTFEEAAALPLSGLAAWQALFVHGRLKGAARVLIHAGAGGVGHIAVQLAKRHGATVVATASTRNHQFLQALGADEVIDYGSTAFEEAAGDVDLILDGVGGETQERSLSILRRAGVMVSLASTVNGDREAASMRIKRMLVRPDLSQLEALTALLESRELKVAVTTVPSLHDIHQAHGLCESAHVRGKVVVLTE